MNIGILTSSRADYGIYVPLLKELKEREHFHLSIFVFGTHVSAFHEFTLDQIRVAEWGDVIPVESLVLGDSAEAISSALGLTILKFSSIWQQYQHRLDLIICLGDRYEMFAAVSASVPFNIPLAHIHGGETSLGAMDNVFRHAMTHMADYHFVSTELYASKVKTLNGSDQNVWHVGALSLDHLQSIQILSKTEFQKMYGIDLEKPTGLITLHPETRAGLKNIEFADELIAALEEAKDYQWVITMPNADTLGNQIRVKLKSYADKNSNAFLVKNFGTVGYFSLMTHCSFLLGNTSSGIIEAASFQKYVINLGDRQKGRACSENIIHTPFAKKTILQAIEKVNSLGNYAGENIYWNGGASHRIVNILSQLPYA